MPNAIVTGGSGFVGSHLIKHLINSGHYGKILNIDIEPPGGRSSSGKTGLHFLKHDLREELDASKLKELGFGSDTVIFNLAAICRIPGYPAGDYFKTNIASAETVCKMAEDLNCSNIVFTSSIAPYGASEELKTEESIPQPDNPYGTSKLIAEYIHKGWFEQEPQNRHLTILRPGIIFGPNEGANFTRLYESLKKGFFVYPGRKDTKKACVYVKDVTRACEYFAKNTNSCQLYNLVYKEAPTIETICRMITKNTDAGKARFTLPGWILVTSASVIEKAGNILGKGFTGIHPRRVKKVMTSTNISGDKISKTKFSLKYSLEEGIIDWKHDCGGILK